MTDNPNYLDIDQKPSEQEDSYGRIKGVKTEKGADVYAGLSNAHMSFDGIGCLEACAGDIVLRGRNGQRDVIFPLEKAVRKYQDWMAMTHAYARQAISGWTQMMDIAQDFRARICEAVEQRKQLQLPIPNDALQFAEVATSTKKPTIVVPGTNE